MIARLILGLLSLSLLFSGPARGEESPPASAPQGGLNGMVRDLLPIVSRIRGLPWKRPVEARMLSKEKLKEHLVRMMAEDYPEADQIRDNRVAHRLGMLRADQEIAPLVRALLEEMVAGYYDPVAKKLFVIEGPIGIARKPTLVHELIHALDDQHFDLRAIEEPFEDDADRQFAIRCLWEGCAVHAQNLFAALDPKAAAAEIQQAFDDPEQNGSGASSLKTTPTWLIVDSLLHYRAGPYLVGQLAKQDFPATMAALFQDPPTTQEQFLHPERWMDPQRRDYPRSVVWAGPWEQVGRGWKVVHDTPVGELNLALFFNHFLDGDEGRLSRGEVMTGQYVTDESHRGACGWDAGRAVALERPGSPLVVVHAFAFDTTDDAREAATTLRKALKLRNDTVWKTPDAWALSGKDDATYKDGQGTGVIVRRDRELLWIDGFTPLPEWTAETGPGDWEPLVEHLLMTTFEQDPRDAGDHLVGTDAAAKDPFAGCAFVAPRRGIGVRVPTDEWEVRGGAQGSKPGAPVAVVSRKGATLRVIVMEQGLSKGALPVLLKSQVGELDESKLRPMPVAGWDGVRYQARRTPSQHVDIYAGSDGIRTVVVIALGQVQIMRLYDDEIERIVSEIISIPQY